MTSAAVSMEVSATPEQVWQLIGGFGSLPAWVPFVKSCHLDEGGRLRHFETSDGAQFTERLIAFDEKARNYVYAIEKSPLPITSYLSRIRVEPLGEDKARVEWTGEFTPTAVSDAEAEQIVLGIYKGGLGGIVDRFKETVS